MWIFTPTGFLSIVDKGDATGRTLLVRARRAGEIESIFPGVEVVCGGGTDYRYRARIDRSLVAATVGESVAGIRYPNFKSEIRSPDYHDACFRVWDAMHRYQEAARGG